MTDTNDGGAQPQTEGAAAPGMHILGQYIKDLVISKTRTRHARWLKASSRTSRSSTST